MKELLNSRGQNRSLTTNVKDLKLDMNNLKSDIANNANNMKELKSELNSDIAINARKLKSDIEIKCCSKKLISLLKPHAQILNRLSNLLVS